MNAPERSSHWYPRAGGLPDRVLQWFCTHPDEELTAMDIAVKFGVGRPENVHGQLAAAVRAGRLARCAAQTPHLYRLPTREEAAASAQPRRERLYLSGPMTGTPGLNFDAFHAETARLRGLGYEVANPAELNPDQDASWHTCMRADLKALLDCDALVLLPGWEQSAGAHLEMHVAHRVGIQILQSGEVVA